MAQYPSNRLEQMLTYYEDECCLGGIIAQYGQKMGYTSDVIENFPYSGPFRHWRELRAHLRDVGRRRGPLDIDRFVRFPPGKLKSDFASMLFYPTFLHSWTIFSRRIFHLDKDLQALLSAMSFRGMTWSDILLPFDCFVITLSVPIQTDIDEYDAVIIRKVREPGGSYGLSLGLFSTNLSRYKSLTPFDRDALQRSAKKGAPSAKSILEDIGGRFPGTAGPFVITFMDHAHMENFVNDPVIADGQETMRLDGVMLHEDASTASAINHIFRLFACFCLYLSSLPPGSSHRSSWGRALRSGKRDEKAITDDAEVCTVTSMFDISPEEREVFLSRSNRGELCAHYRRGHYRRRPGEGEDPNAPRIVPVKPALIRGERLGPGELPGGSLATVR